MRFLTQCVKRSETPVGVRVVDGSDLHVLQFCQRDMQIKDEHGQRTARYSMVCGASHGRDRGSVCMEGPAGGVGGLEFAVWDKACTS